MDVRATPPPEGRALFRRRSFALVAHGARGAFLLAIFTGALAGGVVLHANTPSVRRIAVRVTNRVAGRLFEGKIVVGEVHSISLGATSHARIRDVDVKTDNDQPVLHAHQVEASIDLRRLLRALATHRPADVVLNELRIDELDLRLDADAREGTSIARAFRAKGTPVAPTPPATERPENPATPTTAPEAPPRTPTVRITRASIGRGQLRGNLVPPELDGTISDFQGRVDLEEGKLAFTLESTGLTLHSPRAPNQTAPMTGTARGVFGMDLATARLTGKADVVGACGAVPVVAHAELDGDKVDATVDIARTTPDAIATAFANLPLSEPGELHARAHGILPTIAIDARAKLGAANVSASGEIDLRAGKAFKLDVDAAQLDARAFGTDLETKVSGKIHVDGTLEGGGGPLASFRIVTAESQVAGEHIPATTVEGRFEAQRVTAVLRTSERNAYASGKVTFDIPTQVSTFDLQARSDSLRTLARLPTGMNGAASARAQGKVDLAKRTIFATTTMSADDLSTVGFSANRISANGVISGPLTSPSLDVGFAGVGLELRAENKTPLVYPTATGNAKIALVPTPRVVEASINVGYEGSSEGVTASAQGVQVVNGVVEARNVYITGLGAPLELDARIGKGQWKIRAKSSRVDLHRVARMTGIRELSSVPDGTHALVDVDFQQKDGWSDGHIDLIVETDTGLFGNSVVAEAHAKIERNKLTGSAKVAADGFGKLEVIRAEVDVPSRLDARSLQRATGDIELRGTVDLSQGAA
ncbi:MAG TPA: hypothetical protein VM580_10550, partial [Labilithrix sp.]|nr:hypothetical protein [Labilithrix sp.]